MMNCMCFDALDDLIEHVEVIATVLIMGDVGLTSRVACDVVLMIARSRPTRFDDSACVFSFLRGEMI